MRINYSGQKKRREEAHRKKQEEKRMRRLNKSKNKQTDEAAPAVDPFQTENTEAPPQS